MEAATAPSPNQRSAPSRDRFLDVVRSFAMAAVVFNHYLFVFYVWDPAGGYTQKIQEMGYAWVTWPFMWELAAFFFVGGAVIHRSATTMPFRSFVAKRVWRLGFPVVIVLATGLSIELVANALDVPNCRPGNGPLLGVFPMSLTCPVQFWVEPLWFMLIFVPLTVASPLLARLYRGRYRWMWIVGLVALVALSDLSLYNGHGALPTSEFAWMIPWLLGFSYADGSLQRMGARRLFGLGSAAGVVAVLAIGFGPWSSVIGRYPRTLESVAEALIWVPIMVAARKTIAGWGDRGPGAWIVRVIGPRMMSIFVWHEPAMAVVVMVIAALQIRLADHVGWVWLAQKIPWFAASLAVLWLMLKPAERLEQVPPPAFLMGGDPPRGQVS